MDDIRAEFHTVVDALVDYLTEVKSRVEGEVTTPEAPAEVAPASEVNEQTENVQVSAQDVNQPISVGEPNATDATPTESASDSGTSAS